ncbi:hypothetical protein PSDVSF_18410 [Pseudodesulfovibrio sediminis]|uniref:Uncharacterized protein n=1 Tax=Pseudodesulfovibrio sediminis TaxID=2810563 RepID=A0ABN6EU68_9BACT|nr:hypothetical protein PSDVSF_18410 [Pseudodesulfovibrio sediminis]
MKTVFQERYGLCLRPLSGPFLPEQYGGLRSGEYRNRGHYAEFFTVYPDAGGDVRDGEEGASQQRDAQDDESDSDNINHGLHKA